jgi:hypothetical protein
VKIFKKYAILDSYEPSDNEIILPKTIVNKNCKIETTQ